MACPSCLVAVSGADGLSQSEVPASATAAKTVGLVGLGLVLGFLVGSFWTYHDAKKTMSQRRYARNHRCRCGG